MLVRSVDKGDYRMPYPEKYRALLDLTLNDVEVPDYAWLTYAVCAVADDACGWGGWIIEGVFKITGERYPTGTGDKLLPSADEQVCPQCGKPTFRTNASVRMEKSSDQTPVHGVPGVDYEVSEKEPWEE
jgi:hypothetical protein